MNKFNESVEIAKNKFPKLNIKYKDKSTLMRVLSTILFFNKNFKEKFVTTIGNTIYYPSEDFVNKNETSSIILLCHELMHLRQNEITDLYTFEYLSPQIFSIFSLFAFFSPWFLIFLVFLLPIPSLFRAYLEFEAYSITLYCRHKLGYNFNVENIIENFTGPNYYYMFPFKKVNNWFNPVMKSIENNNFNCFGLKEVVDNIIDNMEK